MISLRQLVELAPVGSKLDDAIVEADAWFDLCADGRVVEWQTLGT